MQIIRDVDDQFDHAHISGLAKGIADEAHIKLQSIDRQMCQHAQ